MNGIGGGAAAPSWQMDGPSGVAVWKDLDEILTLGCAVEDDRLFLPYTAKVPESLEASSQKVTIRATPVRSDPTENAPIITTAPRGSLLSQFENPPQPVEGWDYFMLEDGRSGYAREEDLRSTLDSALVVRRDGGEWRIGYYGGYD